MSDFHPTRLIALLVVAGILIFFIAPIFPRDLPGPPKMPA